MRTVVERRVHLSPRPESARRARRLVAAALHDAGRVDLVETAELLVSELVTNAVVHARTEIHLLVMAGPTGLHVSVRDQSPHRPSARHYGRGATTGRGLELVTLLSHRYGTDADGAGKTVWFEIGTEAPVPVAPAASRSDETGDETGGETGGSSAGHPAEIRLLGVPVALALAWRQHIDALLREHVLARWEDARPGHEPEGDAHDAFALVADAFGPLAVASPPAPSQDVTVPVTPPEVVGFDALDHLIDEVMTRAEDGQTLTPATQPEIRLLRRWICDEVRHQSRGGAPTPWPGLPSDLPPPDRPLPDWDLGPVRSATAAVVAADDVNRILAASPSALALLGWDEDLLGRRIVEIVPVRLREAHIAGFTRHLLTGDSSILDSEVQVPALRRDGTEVDVVLVVARRSAADGRAVFTATLRPV